ncbi:MAG: hypothetical protein JWM65_3250 [Sphingomonas bacterium]|nr:hypothetical protein [Sphingomonas bacterium]
MIECAQEQIKTSEETARAEQDLTAQQEAAWAAIFSALASAAVLLVTAIGTALLYQQIKLTREAVQDTGEATEAMREANEIARENAYRDLRAYIFVDPSQAEFTLHNWESDDSWMVCFNLRIKNYGRTPANFGISDVRWFGGGAHSETFRFLAGADFVGGLPISPGQTVTFPVMNFVGLGDDFPHQNHYRAIKLEANLGYRDYAGLDNVLTIEAVVMLDSKHVVTNGQRVSLVGGARHNIEGHPYDRDRPFETQ